jgi:DNA-binding MarR family transcriptional regulator
VRTEEDDQEGVTIPPALAGYIPYLLRRVYVRANQVAAEVMPAGTHPRDFAILGVLATRDAYSQQELAEQLGINRTMMVKIIDKLEAAGYVQRQRNPNDRRSYTLSVTPAGHRAMTTMAPAVADGEQRLTAALQPTQRERLNHLLRLLLPDVDRYLPHMPAQRSGYLLLHAYRDLRRRSDDALGALGIQIRHFAALATLDDLGPCAQQQLAHGLGITESAVVQIVDDLQDAGLVERGRNPHDRRQYVLEVTAFGRTRLEQGRDAILAVQEKVTAALGDNGDKELRELLTKILDGPSESGASTAIPPARRPR